MEFNPWQKLDYDYLMPIRQVLHKKYEGTFLCAIPLSDR